MGNYTYKYSSGSQGQSGGFFADVGSEIIDTSKDVADWTADTASTLAKKSRFAKLLEYLGFKSDKPKLRKVTVPEDIMAPPVVIPEVPVALPGVPTIPSELAPLLAEKSSAAKNVGSGTGKSPSKEPNVDSQVTNKNPKQNTALNKPTSSAYGTGVPGSGKTNDVALAGAGIGSGGPQRALGGQGVLTPTPPTPFTQTASNVTPEALAGMAAPKPLGSYGRSTMLEVTASQKSFDSFIMSKLAYQGYPMQTDPTTALGLSLPGLASMGVSAYAGHQLGDALSGLGASGAARESLAPISEMLENAGKGKPHNAYPVHQANKDIRDILSELKLRGSINAADGAALNEIKMKDFVKQLASRTRNARSPLFKSLGLLGGAVAPFLLAGATGSLTPGSY